MRYTPESMRTLGTIMKPINGGRFGGLIRGKRKEGFAWLQIRRLRKRFESKEEAKEWAAQVKADWVRNNFCLEKILSN